MSNVKRNIDSNIGKYFKNDRQIIKVIGETSECETDFYTCKVIGMYHNTNLYKWRFDKDDKRYKEEGYKEVKGYDTPLYKAMNERGENGA